MMTNTGSPIPYITAHAGCMDTIPNSRESILAAFASESDIVEVDVRVTRNGVIVLSHDESLNISPGGKIDVKKLSWEDVERYSAAPGPAILRLEAFLDLAAECGGNKVLNLDIKDPSALHEASAIIKSRRLEESVLFSGLGTEGIKIARKEMPGLTYFFNADEMMPISSTQPKDMDAACELASRYGCRGINLEWTRASSSFVEYAKNKGLLVMLWTVDTEEEMLTALSYKPNSLTTNYPHLLAGLIRKAVAAG